MAKRTEEKQHHLTLAEEEAEETEEVICTCIPQWFLLNGNKVEIRGPVCRRCCKGLDCYCATWGKGGSA
jgi:hypothetical protein